MQTSLYRKPLPGLVAFTIAFLSQWLGHSTWAFIREVFPAYKDEVSVLIGAAGAGLIWAGLKKPEVPATWMGFLGALILWVGWFEFTFEFYGEMFAIPEYISPTGMPAYGGAAILMATMPIMMALFLLYGFYNRQTKCNLIRWFHRNLHFSPGMPTNDNGRSFARITALETIFVTWFCYLFWLYVGYFLSQTVIMVVYLGWVAWFGYIFWKLVKFPRVGHAVRYGIPVGVVGWGVAEMPAHFQIYSEIWLKPFEYPLPNAIALLLFVAGFIYVARRPSSTTAEQATPA